MTTAAYPLSWPPGFPRAAKREQGAFKTSLTGALKNVQKSLEAFARDSGKRIDSLVISSNVTLGQERPADPGVAVWFAWDGLQVCIPVDRYTTVQANLQAIHHVIEARRVELRHGTLALVRASFTGFKALTAPASAKPWREVLGVRPEEPVTAADAQARYRQLARDRHPDRGGSDAAMSELNRAWADAQQELSA